ncbi:hypothetical protein CH379_001840 [Leptospira ellisii]|uniref:Uncharacterized protein n=1 Tax=Leptospira ellisii TaxID=2023197 RepID=A0AAE4QK65_9LEPT|nr:hypothetical protein [Leptospira ellisii]MDV6234370.1 hypothetical protein [Leptospira ellisii]
MQTREIRIEKAYAFLRFNEFNKRNSKKEEKTRSPIVEKTRRNLGLLFLLLILVSVSFWIDSGEFYIADSALKAMQTESLIVNGFKTDEIRYPAQTLDPLHEAFFLPGFAENVKGKFIGQYPIAFSIFASLYRAAGLDWKYIPFANSLLSLIALYLLYRNGRIDQKTMVLGYCGTILLALNSDFGEYPLFFLLNTFGFVSWLAYRDTKRVASLCTAVTAFSVAVWFRLESLLFLSALVAAEIPISGQERKNLVRASNVFSIFLSLIPIITFFFWNILEYGHPLGVRFIFNFGREEVSITERIARSFSIAFVNLVDGVPKFGFFFYSPFLILPVLYYLVLKKKRDGNSDFLLKLIGIYSVLVLSTAPNDGITITGRYLLLLLPPLLVLWSGWNPGRAGFWKSVSIFSVVFSLSVSGVTLKIMRHISKQEKSFRNSFAKNETSLWIFTDPILCGQAGIDHLYRKILCVNQGTDLNNILSKIASDDSLSSVSLFFAEEKEIRRLGNSIPLLDRKKSVELENGLETRFGGEKKRTPFKGFHAIEYYKNLK